METNHRFSNWNQPKVQEYKLKVQEYTLKVQEYKLKVQEYKLKVHERNHQKVREWKPIRSSLMKIKKDSEMETN